MSFLGMFALKDVTIRQDAPSTLLLDAHRKFIQAYESQKDYDYIMSEHLRMGGVYWCVTAMDLMGCLDTMNIDEIVEFVKACQDPGTGGFVASQGHDPHLLHTLSAVQILMICDRLDAMDVDAAVCYIVSLQQKDGSFAGDCWDEIDTRFSFCAIAALSLLKRLDAINLDAAIDYVLRCQNFDGGFGTRPGSESHAGQIYCCLGSLAITGQICRIDGDKLAHWLAERQLPSGGLNGRPEKLPDVCYSWWVLTSLEILGKRRWIDRDALIKFILACQDPDSGGISDRPGDMADPFHTVFGLAGLSLLRYGDLKPVNPIFCMPQYVLDRHGVECMK